MITQIEIDGFKTFKDFKVELAPFQVIVGPNGSGKSNLFDALHLLSRLADMDLRTTFQEVRGEAGELFTKLPNGQSVDRMKMAVEMLVDRKVSDDLGEEAELRYTRLRYELEITNRPDEYGMEQLYVSHESLKSIPQEQDNWCTRQGLSSENKWIPFANNDNVHFISTTQSRPRTRIAEAAIPYDSRESMPVPTRDPNTINLLQDGQRPGKISRADKVKRTVLSSVTDIGFPHAFAAREEMRSWRFLHLDPEELRRPSPITSSPFLSSEGKNMPTVLARIKAEDEFAFHWVYLDMANLVPSITGLEIEKDQIRNEYVLLAKTSDERAFSSQALSDGTLRLLALATLKNDPQFHGMLCIEEAENGVDSLHLKNMARLLQNMATDFSDYEQADEALRQVLVTTHSPSFISLPGAIDSLLVAFTPLNSHYGLITCMVPVATPNTLNRFEAEINEDRAMMFYVIDQARKYLDGETLDEARKQLKKARENLIQR